MKLIKAKRRLNIIWSGNRKFQQTVVYHKGIIVFSMVGIYRKIPRIVKQKHP